MAFFKLRVEDKTYELDKLTLGEARILKKDFGLNDLSSFSGTDPDQLVGLLYLALKREKPALSHEEALAEIEGLDIEAFSTPEEDPTPAVAAEPSKAEDGNQATTRKTAGRQPSPTPAA